MVPPELKQRINAMQHAACVLDAAGVAVDTNQSWDRGLVDGNGILALVPAGANYLRRCREMADQGVGIAGEMVKVLDILLQGKQTRGRLTYRHSAARRACQFHITATRIDVDQEAFLLLEHTRDSLSV